jgi:LuxR family maltose regulon positive regulatory protein
VVVVAPAGYGKTTVLAQHAAADDRPACWMTLSDVDNDPPALLAHLLLALESVAKVAPTTFEQVVFSGADLASVLLPRFGAVLADLTPFLLVIDDVHLLRSRDALRILRVVEERLPRGSRLAFLGRAEPPLPIARWRARGDVLDVRAADLTLSEAEGIAMLEGAGAALGPRDAAALVAATEGWAAGLYLSALAVREQPELDAEHLGGDDRLLAEFFLQEVLRALDDEQVRFLTRSSVLDRLSGPECDAVLESTGSTTMLAGLERTNQFIVALDRTREWYRYHHMFRDLLRTELRRREPELEAVLCRRASEWCELHGDVDAAVSYARDGGDAERVAALVWANTFALAGSGRTSTLRRWLEAFTDDEIASQPGLALAAAWAAFTEGPTEDLDRWATLLRARPGTDRLPDGVALEGALALVDAQVGARGLGAVRDDARVACEHYAGGPYRALACLLDGAASRVLGDTTHARARLQEGMHLGSVYLPAAAAHSAAQLALLDADDGNWSTAATMVDRALDVVDQFGLDERPIMSEVFAVAAFVHARQGRSDVKDLAKRGTWLVSMVRGVATFVAVDARILLARALTAIGETGTARTLVAEAQSLLRAYPDPARLPEQLAEVTALLDAAEVPLGVRAAPLSPAELRVLRYLPTHLSFAEIADEVYVSRNTVKTQAIAVYRKLGVSSRTAAVERARAAGLIDA